MSILKAAATADDTLDQTSDTLLNAMTLTPASGDYLLTFTTFFTTPSTAGTETTIFSVYVGGTQIPHTERGYQEDSSGDNTDQTMAIACKVSPNGSQAVEIRYRASGTGSPLVCKNRELNLFPLPAGTNYELSDVADDSISTGTWTRLDSMFVTPAAGDYLLVFGTWGTCSSTDTEKAYRVSVGGTPLGHTQRMYERESSASTIEVPIYIACKISPNGSQVVEIEWSRTQGSGSITSHERTMFLIPIASGDIFEASATAVDTDSTTTDKQIDDLLISAPGADDYLVLFSCTDYFGSVGNNAGEINYSIREGGTKVTDSDRSAEHEGSFDNVNYVAMAGGRVTVAGSNNLQMYWQGSSTTTRTIRGRTFVAIREGVAGPIEVAIGMVTEIDLAQPVAWAPKDRLIGQVVETDLSQGVTSLKAKPVGQVTEINLAQTIEWAPKRRLINQVLESNLAQPVAWAPKARLIGIVVETDLAQPVTKALIISVNQVNETDLAQVVARVPKARLINLASEVDLAQGVTWAPKIRIIGQATEADLAQLVTVSQAKVVAIGQVTEADLAQIVEWAPKHRLVGMVEETDFAFAIAVGAVVVEYGGWWSYSDWAEGVY